MDRKKSLHALCEAYVNDRIATIKQAIVQAQASANDETKSSAGDKYETGRAMMQLEIEKNTTQLQEALKLQKTLTDTPADETDWIVKLGSIVYTNEGNFYIAISAGALTCGQESYFAISFASPIGQLLKGRKVDDEFTFNKKHYIIDKIM